MKNWLPDMDLNHDKQIQSLLCYRYTIGQTDVSQRLGNFAGQSSRQAEFAGSESRKKVAHGVSRGLTFVFGPSHGVAKEYFPAGILSPLRGLINFESFVPRLVPWATICRPSGAGH
jgi:hypothetical protein